MHKHEVTDSFLLPIENEFLACSDLDSARALIIALLNKKDALKGKAARDADYMLVTVRQIQTLRDLQFWYYNNVLAYGGCRVVKPIPR